MFFEPILLKVESNFIFPLFLFCDSVCPLLTELFFSLLFNVNLLENLLFLELIFLSLSLLLKKFSFLVFKLRIFKVFWFLNKGSFEFFSSSLIPGIFLVDKPLVLFRLIFIDLSISSFILGLFKAIFLSGGIEESS